jgi:hypothetical protein
LLCDQRFLGSLINDTAPIINASSNDNTGFKCDSVENENGSDTLQLISDIGRHKGLEGGKRNPFFSVRGNHLDLPVSYQLFNEPLFDFGMHRELAWSERQRIGVFSQPLECIDGPLIMQLKARLIPHRGRFELQSPCLVALTWHRPRTSANVLGCPAASRTRAAAGVTIDADEN